MDFEKPRSFEVEKLGGGDVLTAFSNAYKVMTLYHLVASKEAVFFRFDNSSACLRSLATDSAGKLNVLGHDGDSLGVNGAQVGIFKQTNQVSLASFLKGHHS